MPPIPYPNTVDEPFLALLGLSKCEFREIHAAQIERERNAPGRQSGARVRCDAAHAAEERYASRISQYARSLS